MPEDTVSPALRRQLRTLAEVHVEMTARLEEIGSREARLALHPLLDPEGQAMRLAELKRERVMIAHWHNVISEALTMTSKTVQDQMPDADFVSYCETRRDALTPNQIERLGRIGGERANAIVGAT
jgi:hypothetical protein